MYPQPNGKQQLELLLPVFVFVFQYPIITSIRKYVLKLILVFYLRYCHDETKCTLSIAPLNYNNISTQFLLTLN